MAQRSDPVDVPQGVELGAKITAVILIVLIHTVLIWDVYASMRWGHRATVSVVLNSWVSEFPMIALSTGIVIGHIVWPLRSGPLHTP